MVGFNVANFRAEISKKGIMRPNKFLVRCNIPRGLQPNGRGNDLIRNFEFWAQETQIPPITIATNQVALRYGYGMPEERPYVQYTQPIPISIIADEQGNYWKFFRGWTDMIFNSNYNSLGVQGPDSAYQLSYREQYVTTVTILVFPQVADKVGDAGVENATPSLTINLRDAYPKTVQAINLAWADTNKYGAFEVAFAYTDMFIEY